MKKYSMSIKMAVLVIVLGLAAGAAATGVVAQRDNILARLQTFSSVLSMVRDYYVEEVDSEKLIDAAIRGMLLELDPHSAYLDPERFANIKEVHEGEYFGIGIQFDIINGWLTVISPIEGSPSDNLGLRPGDRIVKINGESARNITNEEVFDKLRGAKGTTVNISVQRDGLDELLEYEITRDKIPIYSVPYKFMVTPDVGYVRLIRFSATTSQELEEALDELDSKGMKKLILDLRDNSGGYLNQAVEVADKFIEGERLLVYTKGRLQSSSQEYHSTDAATHARYPLIVLISHGSASASEIVAGAIQDWDRGLVAGETSFGKGLVQRPFKLRDGSGLLLTVARYYTPSGRLIQRDYSSDRGDYYLEGYTGTADADSAQRPEFHTSMGRKVLGGGGITPDVALEYERLTPFEQQLARGRIAFEYASALITRENLTKESFDSFEAFVDGYEMSESAMSGCVSMMKEREFKFTEEELNGSKDYLRLSIKAEMAGHLWGANERYRVFIAEDSAVRRAIELLPEAEALASQIPPVDAFQKTGTDR